MEAVSQPSATESLATVLRVVQRVEGLQPPPPRQPQHRDARAGRELPYWRQGSKRFYTGPAMCQRLRVKRDPQVWEAVRYFWELLPKTTEQQQQSQPQSQPQSQQWVSTAAF